MLFRTSRTLRGSELQWPLGRGSVFGEGRREEEGEKSKGEGQEEVLEKREEEEDEGMRVEVESRPVET